MEGSSWVLLRPHTSDFSCGSERNVPFPVFIPVYITRCSAFKVRRAAFIISLRINLSGHKSWIYYDRGDGRLITNTAGISIFAEQNLNFPNCFPPLLPLFNLIPAGLQRNLGLWPFRFFSVFETLWGLMSSLLLRSPSYLFIWPSLFPLAVTNNRFFQLPLAVLSWHSTITLAQWSRRISRRAAWFARSWAARELVPRQERLTLGAGQMLVPAWQSCDVARVAKKQPQRRLFSTEQSGKRPWNLYCHSGQKHEHSSGHRLGELQSKERLDLWVDLTNKHYFT